MTEMLRFFGRRKGKPIRSGRAELMEKWLPKLTLKVPARGKIKLEKQFTFSPEALELEIGFGGGEHLAQIALRQPETGFLGAEPFQNGVASLLAHLNGSHDTGTGALKLAEGRPDNVRIWPGDIRELFEKFPESYFKRIYLLYPDPWPKKRHAERRFINTYNIPHLYRLLADDGELMLATDVAPYVDWALEKMAESDLFIQTKRAIHTPPKGWIPTRYEKKGIAAGRQPTYLIFKKKQKK
ncbi:MAG: tRNA (guanine(46)-N(7))-methyltransferase TrmB [Alphaproteobacteria bacterium]